MKNNIIKFPSWALLIIGFSWIIVGCAEVSVDPFDNVTINNYVATEPCAFRVTASGSSKLRLVGINGNVTIEGSAQLDSVIIVCEKRVGSDSVEDAQQHLNELDVTVQNLNNEIFVKTVQPENSNGRSYVIDYSVTVPINYKIEIELITGKLEIEKIENEIIASTVNGNIITDEIFSSTYLAVVNGSISSKQILPAGGTISLATINGNINLQIPGSTSAQFSAEVVNGQISTTNLIFDNLSVSARSQSGRLGNGQGTIALSTVNGNISAKGF